MILTNNKIAEKLEQIAEVASYLWQRNWAEANGGNISVNLTDFAGNELSGIPALTNETPLEVSVPALAGQLFYVSGKGSRMRDIAKSPPGFGAIIRITPGGNGFETLTEKNIEPTSELPSHLSIHNFLKKSGSTRRAVLHSHPTELVALSHCKPFLDSAYLTHTLWSMIPEARVLIPRGVGLVPYFLTGTKELAEASIEHLKHHDVVVWEKHGVLATADDIMACFDLLDVLTKSAQIYLFARQAGFEPQGMSKEQLNELAEAFNLPVKNT